MLKRAVNVIGLILVVASVSARAADADEQAYLALMSLLNAQTELVTKTKVNADYVPGSLTVLRGTELSRYGIRTVKQALSMSTGIEVQQNHLGQSVLVMRGLGTPYAGGTVKLMLDGINMVNSSAGFSESVLHLPIEQVERIEIIRGAASVLHGDFAYSGVINIVSKKNDHFAIGAGSYGYTHASASQVLHATNGARLALSFSQWQQDKTNRKAGGDVLTVADTLPGLNGLAAYSQAPGVINDRQAYRNLLLNWQQHKTEVYFQAQEYQTGDYFGVIEFMPKDTQDYNQRYRDMLLGIRQEDKVNDQWRYDWHVGGQQRSYQLKTLYTSEDVRSVTTYTGLDQPRPVSSYISERVLTSSGHLIYQPNPQHRILMGAELEHLNILDVRSQSKRADGAADTSVQKSLEFASKGDNRQTLAVYLQDEWRPNAGFTLTTGVRLQKVDVDYTDRSGSHLGVYRKLEEPSFTPKIAAVWQLNDQHVLKAQYSLSLITPPIYQVTDTGGKQQDTTQTHHAELGYVFIGARHVQRFSAYYSEYDNMPKGTVFYGYFDGDYGAEPFVRAKTQGLEWDSEFSLMSGLTGFANAAWLETLDVNNSKPVVGSMNRLANLGLNYALNTQWRLTAWLNHVGERAREPYDKRDNLAAYTLTHVTASYASSEFKGLVFSVGVENLADVDYRYPSPVNGTLTTLNSGAGTAAYQDDYPGFGRQIWAKLQYEF